MVARVLPIIDSMRKPTPTTGSELSGFMCERLTVAHIGVPAIGSDGQQVPHAASTADPAPFAIVLPTVGLAGAEGAGVMLGVATIYASSCQRPRSGRDAGACGWLHDYRRR